MRSGRGRDPGSLGAAASKSPVYDVPWNPADAGAGGGRLGLGFNLTKLLGPGAGGGWRPGRAAVHTT